MKQAIRAHLHAYGHTRSFLTTHARLSDGLTGLAVPQDFDLSCSLMEPSSCEHYQLFLAGWREQRKPSSCTRKRILIALQISHPAPPSPLLLGFALEWWRWGQTARRYLRTIYQRLAANRCGPATYQRGVGLVCSYVSESIGCLTGLRPYPDGKDARARSAQAIYLQHFWLLLQIWSGFYRHAHVRFHPLGQLPYKNSTPNRRECCAFLR